MMPSHTWRRNSCLTPEDDTNAEDEFLASIKILYETGRYSDLTIKCRDKEFNVHQPILCPRSEYFANRCAEVESSKAGKAILDMHQDDPAALEACLYYQYYLKYPEQGSADSPINEPEDDSRWDYSNQTRTPPYEERAFPVEAIFPADGRVKVAEGFADDEAHSADDFKSEIAREDFPTTPVIPQAEPLTEPPLPEDAVPLAEVGTPSLSKKQKKRAKKARKAAAMDPASENAESTADPVQAPEQESATPKAESDLEPNLEPVYLPVIHTTLSLHAAVYKLSQKLGTERLTRLALCKFREAANDKWSSEDFLSTIKAVYSDDAVQKGRYDKGLKSVITDTLIQHQELLDRPETMEALDKKAMWDLVTRMRSGGSSRRSHWS